MKKSCGCSRFEPWYNGSSHSKKDSCGHHDYKKDHKKKDDCCCADSMAKLLKNVPTDQNIFLWVSGFPGGAVDGIEGTIVSIDDKKVLTFLTNVGLTYYINICLVSAFRYA